jgi:hypothetical protein
LAARAGCAACFVVVLRLQRGCVGACEGVRGSLCKSQPCGVILVTQEMRVRETVVSLYAHRRHSLRRRALEDGEKTCPPLRPALGGCSAIFKHMPPVSRVVEEEEEAHKNGTWGASHSRDGVRHACMGRELCGAGWARYSAGCCEGTDCCLASPVWFMVGSSAD